MASKKKKPTKKAEPKRATSKAKKTTPRKASPRRSIRRCPARKYSARRGAPFSDKDAQAIGEYLTRIGAEFTPNDVLEAARNPRSPIHRYFDWDDTSAAEKYRLHQARNLVNSIQIEFIGRTSTHVTKAYISVVRTEDDEVAVEDGEIKDGNRRYVEMSRVLDDDEMRAVMKAKLAAELRAMRGRYNLFIDLINDFIDAAEAA